MNLPCCTSDKAISNIIRRAGPSAANAPRSFTPLALDGIIEPSLVLALAFSSLNGVGKIFADEILYSIKTTN